MTKLKYLALILISLAALLLVSPSSSLAFDLFGTSCNGAAATSAACQQAKSQTATDNPVVNTIQTATSILAILAGLLAVIMIIASGFSYVTSAGNTEATAKAKKRIVSAVVGLVIVGLAWTIIRVITDRVIQ